MTPALRGAASCVDESPIDEALVNIVSALSSLGSEVSGLAIRHRREVAALRAESSWLARELQVAKWHSKWRSASQEEAATVSSELSIPGEEKIALSSASLRSPVSPAALKRTCTAPADPVFVDLDEAAAPPCCKQASVNGQLTPKQRHSALATQQATSWESQPNGRECREDVPLSKSYMLESDQEVLAEVDVEVEPLEDRTAESYSFAKGSRRPDTIMFPTDSLRLTKAPDVPHFSLCKELNLSAEVSLHCVNLDDLTKTQYQRTINLEHEGPEQKRLRRRLHCIGSPVSVRRLLWECCGIVILFYDMVMIPMQAFAVPQNDFLTAMSWLTLYYWTLDVLSSFMVGYYSPDGKLIMDFKPIAIRYIKTWFVLDMLIIGVDWFSIFARLLTSGQYALESDEGAEQNLSVMRAGKVLRVLRLARLLRVMKLSSSNFFLLMEEKVVSEHFFVMSNLFKNVAVITVLSHFCACGWYGIGQIEVQGYGNWIGKYEMDRYSWFFSYLSSVHWALAQFAGEVLIEPQNIIEQLMSVFVLLASLILFSGLVAIVGNTVQQLIQRGAQLRNQQWIMRLYLRQHGISLDLKMRVNRYIGVMTDTASNRIDQKDVKLIELLSRPLHIELQTELFLKHLIMHPFFVLLSKRSFSITRSLCCNVVRQVLLSRGDTLFSDGEEVHLMYFNTIGTLQYLPQNKTSNVSLSLAENQYFCEAVLWTDRWLSCGLMRAETECELVGLDGQRFREVMTQYHTANMLLPTDYGAAFVESLNGSLKEFGIFALSDVQTHLLETVEVRAVLAKYSAEVSPMGRFRRM